MSLSGSARYTKRTSSDVPYGVSSRQWPRPTETLLHLEVALRSSARLGRRWMVRGLAPHAREIAAILDGLLVQVGEISTGIQLIPVIGCQCRTVANAEQCRSLPSAPAISTSLIDSCHHLDRMPRQLPVRTRHTTCCHHIFDTTPTHTIAPASATRMRSMPRSRSSPP